MQNFDLLAAPTGKSGNIEESINSLVNNAGLEESSDKVSGQVQFSELITDIESQRSKTQIQEDQIPVLTDLLIDEEIPDIMVTVKLSDMAEKSSFKDLDEGADNLLPTTSDMYLSDSNNIYKNENLVSQPIKESGLHAAGVVSLQQSIDYQTKNLGLESEFSRQDKRIISPLSASNTAIQSQNMSLGLQTNNANSHSQNIIPEVPGFQAAGGELLPEGGKLLPPSPLTTPAIFTASEAGLIDGDTTVGTQTTSPLLAATSADSLNPGSRISASSSASLPVLQSSMQAGSTAWLEEFSGQIRFMGHFDIKHAEINLNPAELGAIEIKISSSDDLATVNFITSNPATREMIENSLPRLREMLASFGLNLADSSVSQEGQGQGEKTNAGKEINQASTGSGNQAEEHDSLISEVNINMAHEAGRINFYV